MLAELAKQIVSEVGKAVSGKQRRTADGRSRQLTADSGQQCFKKNKKAGLPRLLNQSINATAKLIELLPRQ